MDISNQKLHASLKAADATILEKDSIIKANYARIAQLEAELLKAKLAFADAVIALHKTVPQHRPQSPTLTLKLQFQL